MSDAPVNQVLTLAKKHFLFHFDSFNGVKTVKELTQSLFTLDKGERILQIRFSFAGASGNGAWSDVRYSQSQKIIATDIDVVIPALDAWEHVGLELNDPSQDSVKVELFVG